MVEPEPANSARCTSSIRCASPISATRSPRISAAIRTRRARSRACASSTSAAAAGCCASRWRGSAPTSSAPTRRRPTSRSPRLHAGGSRRRDRLPRHRRPRSWPTPAKSSTWCSTWKWSSTSPTSVCSSRNCAEMVKPGGIMFVATINRTLKALGLAIVGAEYVLRWLPRGTHQYGKLVRPDELEKALADRHGDHRPHRRRSTIRSPTAGSARRTWTSTTWCWRRRVPEGSGDLALRLGGEENAHHDDDSSQPGQQVVASIMWRSQAFSQIHSKTRRLRLGRPNLLSLSLSCGRRGIPGSA